MLTAAWCGCPGAVCPEGLRGRAAIWNLLHPGAMSKAPVAEPPQRAARGCAVHTAGRPLLPLCTDRTRQQWLLFTSATSSPVPAAYCGQGPCSTNHHRLGGLKTMRMYSLAVLESKRLKSRCQGIDDTWKYFPDTQTLGIGGQKITQTSKHC